MSTDCFLKGMFLSAVVILLSFAVIPQAQAEVQTNESFPLSLTAFVPCANDGIGELVDVSGNLHILVTATINNNHVSGTTHYQPQGVVGEGRDTGDKYHAVGITRDHFSGELQGGSYTYTFTNSFMIIGQGPGNNFTVHETIHITINANGETTVEVDNFKTACD
jgi:hypothetical protein